MRTSKNSREGIFFIAAQLSDAKSGKKNPFLSSGFPVQTLTLEPTLLRTTSSLHLKSDLVPITKGSKRVWLNSGRLAFNPSPTTDELGDLGKESQPSHL